MTKEKTNKCIAQDNNVSWYGLDDTKYDNSNSISDIKVGDEVIVFDLSNYIDPQPKLPAKAIVTAIYEFEIDVQIEGWPREYPYEIYEFQFGIKK